MADLSGLTTNYFSTPKEGFTTTLASTISSGATTVPLNSITGYTNGAIATMVVEPTSATAKQVFTGVVDTAGIQLTSVKWTEGTNQSHAAGSTVVDYVTATHMAALVKGLTTSTLDQDGTLKAGAVDNSAAIANAVVTTSKLSTELQKGWEDSYNGTTHPTPSTVTYNGNGSYDLLYASSVAAFKSVGMRNRTTRTVTAPTGALTLNGTNQSASKTGTITGLSTGTTWTFKIKAKLNSYKSQVLACLDDGSTNILQVVANSSGQIGIQGGTYAALDQVTSYQSHPLSKWFEITLSITIGTPTGEITMNGAVVPSFVSASAATTFTAASTTIYVGRNASGNYVDGKVAQLEVFNTIVTAATLRGQSSQTIDGSESGAILAYKLDQASGLTDLKNGNNLTANNAPTYTTDSPWTQDASSTPGGSYDYSITTKVSSDGLTETVQVPEGCTIPTTGGVSAMSYSSVKVPYGFPAQRNRWMIETRMGYNYTSGANPTGWQNTTYSLTIPVGDFEYGYDCVTITSRAANGTLGSSTTLSTTTSTETDAKMTDFAYGANDTTRLAGLRQSDYISLSAATPYYLLIQPENAGTYTAIGLNSGSNRGYHKIYAIPAHL